MERENHTANIVQEPQTPAVRWTPEQEQVIRLRDRSMLVSAAAGSGKTAVLVERIISMVTDETHPIDVDQLLVVTFTNAAAAEMRERVLAAIEKAANADPANVHLQRQMTLIHNAQITTIDSFCNDVLKNYFHKIGLEPGFRIADPGELTLLREDVCDAVLEEFYAKKDKRFFKFVDGYSTAKSDAPVRDMILRMYDFSQSYPWPEEWLAGCVSQYRMQNQKEIALSFDNSSDFNVWERDVKLDGQEVLFEGGSTGEQNESEKGFGETGGNPDFEAEYKQDAPAQELTEQEKKQDGIAQGLTEQEKKQDAFAQGLTEQEKKQDALAQGLSELEKKPWVADFLSYLHTRIAEEVERYRAIYELTLAPDGPQMYEGVIKDDLRQLQQLLSCEHLLDWQETLESMEFKRLPAARKYDGSERKKETVMGARNALKKQITDYRKKYFSSDMRTQVELLERTGDMVEVLVELVKAFADRFRAEKMKKNMLDFSDVEHYALDILVDTETKEPTETAAELRARFREIMIDEYQDSNYVQEALLTAVSGISEGHENFFMVGDVKQSIYRFRLARPELFMQKYDAFSTEENARQRIDLHKNFRSRGEVVDIVNDIFARIMGRDLGNVEYDRDAALYQGASFPESEDADAFRPECILVTDDPAGEDKKTAEARAVAQRIRRLVGYGNESGAYTDWQDESEHSHSEPNRAQPGNQKMDALQKRAQGSNQRQYRDCVILLRSLSGWAETFQKVFEEEGIPLIVSSQTGYFSAPEVQTVLAMLRILDNPCQDIPLAAVMKSEIGRFTDEELAQIRIAGKDMPFFQCVQTLGEIEIEHAMQENFPMDVKNGWRKNACAENGTETGKIADVFVNKNDTGKPRYVKDEDGKAGNCRIELGTVPIRMHFKLHKFWNMLMDFRRRIPFTPIHELLQQIYDETHFRDYVTALPAGEQRRANLDMLLEKAIAYEQTSYHGLFHFVRYIDRLMKYDVDYGEAEIIGEQENAVRLMTIHKSKGLEFPVVILAGMGKNFNMTDANSGMIFHPEYGVGLKYHDAERRTKTDTLIRQVFSIETKRENLGEELRVLYVALTRAREKLIMTGFYKDDGLEPVTGLADYEKLPFSMRMDAKCYWDWVLPALMSYGGRYKIECVSFESRLGEECGKQEMVREQRKRLEQELMDVDDAVYQQIDAQLSWSYPFEKSEILKQKVSVSEIKHRAMEEMDVEFSETAEQKLFPQEIPNPYIPKFVQEQEENRGAKRGTAMHRFMECLDFAVLPEYGILNLGKTENQDDLAPNVEGAVSKKRESGDFKESNWCFAKKILQGISEKMLADGQMSEADMELVNLYQIYQFLQMDAAGRMCKAAKNGFLKKEQPFVMSLAANRVWQDASAESVLVQGIIDVFWEEADGFVLLDYKTDHVDTPEELIARYRAQLLLYAEAVERMFAPKKVSGILIYSFRLNRVIEI